jgi:hypothetical protein
MFRRRHRVAINTPTRLLLLLQLLVASVGVAPFLTRTHPEEEEEEEKDICDWVCNIYRYKYDAHDPLFVY